MTRVLGRIVTPNVATAPSSPGRGELWYDTATDTLKWWSGTAWVPAMGTGGGGAVASVDPWHAVGGSGEPAFQNSWVNYAAGYDVLSFRKMPDGTVRIKGTVKSGTASSVVFTLPAGYRPAAMLTPAGNLYTTSYVASGVVIYPDGRVSTQGSTNTMAFMDCSFVADDAPVTQITAVAANVQMDSWHTVGAAGEPAFASGVTQYAGGVPLQFRKDPTGQVMIRGNVNCPAAASSVIFTLPVGYRPPTAGFMRFAAADVSTGAYMFVYISSGGDVVKGSATLTTIDFAGLVFDTDTVTQVAAGAAAQPIEAIHAVGSPGEPAFTNGWSNYDGAAPAGRYCRFRKFPDGRVRLQGCFKGTTNGTVLFTLPAGYRPSVPNIVFTAQASGGTATLVVNAAGDVSVANQGAGLATTFSYLDGVEFDTESVANYTVPQITGGVLTAQDEGVGLAARAALNFVGSGVTVTDDAANNRSNVAIPPTISYRKAMAGSGGALAGALSGLPGLSLTFTTPNYPVTCDVQWSARFDSTTAAWVYSGTSCACTPAPVLQLGSQNQFNTLASTYSGGQNYFNHVGFDSMDLLPNTSYTLNICGMAAAGSVVWSTGGQSVVARLYAR